MNPSEAEIESLSRQRVRVGVWIVVGFVLVLAGIAANDALVQAGLAFSALRAAAFVPLIGGGIVLLTSLARFIAITRRSMHEPALRRKLWDELASANHLRSIALAHMATFSLLVVFAVFSMFTTLSAPWLVNALLVTALGAQAVSFALLERRGAASADARD